VEIREATIRGGFVGVASNSAVVPVFIRRSRIAMQSGGVSVSGSGIVNVYNSVIEAGDGNGVVGRSLGAQGPVLLTVRGTTIVGSGSGSGQPGVVSNVVPSASGSVNVFVHDSIIRNFQTTYSRQAPTDPADGQANLTLRYSNFVDNGSFSGDGLLTLGPANVSADPLFTSPTNYRLLPGSPAIDAADPMPNVTLVDDFDGLSRPVDGDGDGIAERDMGAFEYRPAPPVDPGDPADPQEPKKKKKKKCKRKKKKGKAKSSASAKKKKRKKCKRKKKRKRR
jgi:hypothetical protein